MEKGKDVAYDWQLKNSWNSVYQGKCMQKLESNQNSM